MAKLISLLFHPFSFFLLGVLIFFNSSTFINFSYSNELKVMVYLVILVNTMIIPVAFAWYLLSKGHIQTIMMENVEDRKLMYFFTLLLYLITLFILSGFSVPGHIYKFGLAATITTGVLFILTFAKVKLSAHMAALGGLTGALIMLSLILNTDFLNLICVVFLLSGIVATSRLRLNAHKEFEIYWGFLLGFLSQVLIFS